MIETARSENLRGFGRQVIVGARPRVSMVALVAALVVIAEPAATTPSDIPFKVANFPVDASAKDAVTAKDKAHADGQAAAFRSLLKRLVPVTAYDRLKQLRETNASGYVQGVSVRSERNSATTYIASLDFSFSPQGLRDFLKEHGVPFVDTQAAPAVLVALVRETEASGSTRAQSLWLNAWKGLDLEHALTPLRVEPLKDTIHADTLKRLFDGSGGGDRILAGEYGTDSVVTAIADVDRPANRLHVVLSGQDAVGPIYLKRSYSLASADLGYTLELAAVVALGTIEGRWKAVAVQSRGGVHVMAGPAAELRLSVEFSSLSQWNDIRQQLLETPGVDDVSVDSVSARSAEVSLRFPGGGNQLADALAPKGLSLRDNQGHWLLRSSF